MRTTNKAILIITGAFIREKRKQLGYNSNGIAMAVKVSQPVISNIERGKYPGLKYETLYAILQFLGTSMSELEAYADQSYAD